MIDCDYNLNLLREILNGGVKLAGVFSRKAGFSG